MPSKQCTKCLRLIPVDDFPRSTAHGKPVVRRWCKDCLKAYYRNLNERKRAEWRLQRAY